MNQKIFKYTGLIPSLSNEFQYIDFDPIVEVKAFDEKELRLKVRGVLLAQLDEIMNRVIDSHFRAAFITKAGQIVDESDLRFINSIPAGHGAVSIGDYDGNYEDPSWLDQVLYIAPAGSTLPRGDKLKEGEFITLHYDDKQVEAFFGDKRNLVNWKKQYDENDFTDTEK